MVEDQGGREGGFVWEKVRGTATVRREEVYGSGVRGVNKVGRSVTEEASCP